MLMRISRNISIEMELTDIVWLEEELMNILSNVTSFTCRVTFMIVERWSCVFKDFDTPANPEDY